MSKALGSANNRRDCINMEIYHRRTWWLGLIFIAPKIWLSLSLAGLTSTTIAKSEVVVVYIIIGICFLVSVQCFFGSTSFYFDNNAGAAVQVRKHFYGEKAIHFPYSTIIDISVRCYRRGKNGNKSYRVGITQSEKLFGQSATKFTEAKSFGGTDNALKSALDFAKEISSYTQISVNNNSDVIRQDAGHLHLHG